MHEDLIFNAAGGIGRKLDFSVGPEGADRFDESDGADGDQVFDIDACVFKPPGKPTLVPASDKRQAITTNAKNEFNEISED